MDLNDPCIFCEIQKYPEERFIYENEKFYSLYCLYPVSPGHSLIMPKRHIASFFEMDDEEKILFHKAIADTREIYQSADMQKIYEQRLQTNIGPEPPYYADSKEIWKRHAKAMLASPFLNKKTNDFNIGINDGVAAGRTIHHMHIQLIPRYTGDVENPRGGVRNVLSLGDYTK